MSKFRLFLENPKIWYNLTENLKCSHYLLKISFIVNILAYPGYAIFTTLVTRVVNRGESETKLITTINALRAKNLIPKREVKRISTKIFRRKFRFFIILSAKNLYLKKLKFCPQIYLTVTHLVKR